MGSNKGDLSPLLNNVYTDNRDYEHKYEWCMRAVYEGSMSGAREVHEIT